MPVTIRLEIWRCWVRDNVRIIYISHLCRMYNYLHVDRTDILAPELTDKPSTSAQTYFQSMTITLT